MAQVYDKVIVDVRVKRDSIITAVQNDANSRFLDVYLKDNGLPINLSGHEVRIYCRKPEDGGEIYNNGVITEAANGRCQFPLTDQTLAKVGYVEAQIIIYYKNVQILQTMEFKIHVVKSLFSKNAVQSSNEYGALVVLYQNLYEAHDLMTTMVQNIGVPGEIAGQLTIDTMWEAWEYLCNYVSEDLTTLLQNAINNNSVDGVIQRLGNTADADGTVTAGTVMGKLNSIIEGKKYKSFKKVTVSLPADATNFILLSVSGAGEFYGVWTTCKILRVSVDGGTAMGAGGSTSTYAFSPYIVNGLVGRTTSAGGPDLIPPMPFKDSLIITADAQSTSYGAIIVYALYE